MVAATNLGCFENAIRCQHRQQTGPVRPSNRMSVAIDGRSQCAAAVPAPQTDLPATRLAIAQVTKQSPHRKGHSPAAPRGGDQSFQANTSYQKRALPFTALGGLDVSPHAGTSRNQVAIASLRIVDAYARACTPPASSHIRASWAHTHDATRPRHATPAMRDATTRAAQTAADKPIRTYRHTEDMSAEKFPTTSNA